ncbi:MAG: hypothetical protein ACRC4W_00130 [Treponemataceae bacterium]
MGQGLGKDSPVVLLLGKENYEALISRHGQWTRWRVSNKCPCVKHTSQQPDIHCDKCGGLGFVYTYQKKRIITQTVLIKDETGVVQLKERYEKSRLVKVYDNTGIIYSDVEKKGVFVFINGKPPKKSSYLTILMEDDILMLVDNASCTSIGYGNYRVDGLRVSRPSTDGLYHNVPCDIEKIDKVVDAKNEIYEVKELRQDCFYIDEKLDDEGNAIPIENPVNAYGISYIEPFTFVILSQNLTKSDAQHVQEQNGDAVLTFPYAYDVANDDVVTVLSGTYTNKNVITKKNNLYDVIPAYFVDEVICCIGKKREYTQGKDFILIGTNRLKWTCDDMPSNGEAYSITYKVNPTYKVVKAIPQIRTSENQRMPKKAVVKLFDTYGEKRGVNKQDG